MCLLFDQVLLFFLFVESNMRNIFFMFFIYYFLLCYRVGFDLGLSYYDLFFFRLGCVMRCLNLMGLF